MYLAAAITTIFQIGDGHALRSAVDRAWGASRVETQVAQGLHTLSVSQPGLRRPTQAAELSDGTLRFLYLAATLLTPRPPGLLVLNEPETGLNPAVMEPPSELVTLAAEASQVILTTHSDLLADRLASEGARRVRLTRSAEGPLSWVTESPWAIRQGGFAPCFSGPLNLKIARSRRGVLNRTLHWLLPKTPGVMVSGLRALAERVTVVISSPS
jgi:AAA domain, putative AbiEii toxin, Type IV TA system